MRLHSDRKPLILLNSICSEREAARKQSGSTLRVSGTICIAGYDRARLLSHHKNAEAIDVQYQSSLRSRIDRQTNGAPHKSETDKEECDETYSFEPDICSHNVYHVLDGSRPCSRNDRH